MSQRIVRAAAPVLLALLAACVGRNQPKEEAAPVPPQTKQVGDAVIITAAILQQRSRSLLGVMREQLPFMQVQDASPCPDIFLRGRSTVQSESNPVIYVDGQRASNTCVLEMMNSLDVNRIEIYPSGVPRNAAYPTSPYGLILIFGQTWARSR